MSLKLYKYHGQEVSRIVKLILIYSDCSRIVADWTENIGKNRKIQNAKKLIKSVC